MLQVLSAICFHGNYKVSIGINDDCKPPFDRKDIFAGNSIVEYNASVDFKVLFCSF